MLDGTGKNYKKLVANIEQAKKAGKNVKIEVVFIDFDKASAFNKKRDRTVPESILRETHKGYRESLVRLLKEHPDLDVSLTVNTGKRDVNGRAIGFPVPHERIIKFMLLQKDL